MQSDMPKMEYEKSYDKKRNTPISIHINFIDIRLLICCAIIIMRKHAYVYIRSILLYV